MSDYITIRNALNIPETRQRARIPNRHTIKSAIMRGDLDAIKPGQDYLIKRADYLTWLKGFPYKPGPVKVKE